MRASTLLVLLTLAPCCALAKPYLPARDDLVLEQLPPADDDTRQLQALQHAYAQNPTDRRATNALIAANIHQGRHAGDARYYGYAEALIRHARAQAQIDKNDPDLLLYEADILQRRHDFDGALVRLNKLLRAHPDHAPGHLMRAVIAMARADDARAMEDCRAVLSPQNGALTGITCVMMVEGLTGSLAPSYAKLSGLYQQFSGGASVEERGWALAALADMAVRLGDDAAAESHLREAIRIESRDYFAIAALSDILLRTARAEEVVALVEPYTNQDGLLLRSCLAKAQRRERDTDRCKDQMRARMQASTQRGERVHLREHARFYLELDGDAARAVRIAQENWKTQKEPADARILWQAAHAAGDEDAQRAVLNFQRLRGTEDAILQPKEHP